MLSVSLYSMILDRLGGAGRSARFRGELIFLLSIFVFFDLFLLRETKSGPLFIVLNDIQLGMVPFLLFLSMKDVEWTTGMGRPAISKVYLCCSIVLSSILLFPRGLSYVDERTVRGDAVYYGYYGFCLLGSLIPIVTYIAWLGARGARKSRGAILDGSVFMALYIALLLMMAFDGMDGVLDKDPRLIPRSVYAVFALAVYGLVTNGLRLRRINGHNRFLAEHDDLTGAFKRAIGVARMDDMIESRKAEKSPFSCILVDFNNFKRVNDLYGYAAGNRCLHEVADRLRRALPKDTLLCRMEGDEFLIVAECEHSSLLSSSLLGTVFDEVSEPVLLESVSVKVSLRAGVSVYPEHGESASELLRNANDCLIYARKKKDGFRCVAYSDELGRGRIDYYKIEDELKTALDSPGRDEAFLLHYQPKVDRDGVIRGLEGLVRWARGGEIVPPYRFISVAERSGLINDIGRIVLEKGCRALKEWRKERGWDITISVNIAPSQVEDPRLLDIILATIKANGIEPSCLEIELTESTIMEPSEEERIVGFLNEVSSHGIRTSIDDFGTGYSSFSRIVDLPVDVIKIDRSIAMHTGVEGKSRRVCRSLIQLAHELGIEVVAEGVDMAEQAKFLFDQGCDYIQGYYFFKPMPGHEIERLIRVPVPVVIK